MGYRNRLGRIPKSAKKKYENCATYAQAEELMDDRHQQPYYPPEHVELLELGKYVDYLDEECEKFYNFDLDEVEFFIVNREFLIKIIEEYRSNVVHMYAEMLDDYLLTKKRKGYGGSDAMVHAFLSSMVDEWSAKFYDPLCFDSESLKLTNSWRYEYDIFNLLHILHTFDWENDYLIYSGW